MRRWLWLVSITLLLGTTQVLAQEPSGATFYGLKADNTLVSYTLDGSETELLDGVSFEHIRLIKTDLPENPLLVAKVDGTLGLYLVGPVQAPQPIKLPEGFDLESHYWFSISNHHPYYVLQLSGGIPETTALLVNVDTLEAQLLTGRVFFSSSQSIFFSDDGSKLRYTSRTDANSNTWNLIERDVASGAERIFYSFNENFPIVSVSSDGEAWLFRVYDRNTQTNNITLVKPNGRITNIAQEPRRLTFFRGIFNDMLYAAQADCKTGCEVKITPLGDVNNDNSTVFTAPALETFPVPVSMPDADHLLIMDEDTYWMLGTDGSAQNLGLRDPVNIYTPLALSSDNRWLMTVTADEDGERTGYKVWDLQTRTTVLENSLPRGLNVYYGDEGLIVWEYPDRQRVYRYSDGKVFDLDMGATETLYMLATPDIGIVATGRESEIGGRGIYALDLDTGTYTLLADDTRALFAG